MNPIQLKTTVLKSLAQGIEDWDSTEDWAHIQNPKQPGTTAKRRTTASSFYEQS